MRRISRRSWRGFALLALLGAVPAAEAEQEFSVIVEETAGIRRTRFPVRTVLDLPAGRLRPTEPIRFTSEDAEVPLQATVRQSWGDGSIRELELDFNVSIGPLETSAFQVQLGQEPATQAGDASGLTLIESEGVLQVGRIGPGTSGSPLLRSVDYRGELIAQGLNGIGIRDLDGVPYGPSQITWGPAMVMKPGPITVHVRQEGALLLDDGGRIDFVLDVEMPDSKSWVKLAAVVLDPNRRLRELEIHTPIRLGDFPWTWDFGTPNGTYGAFRDETGSVILTQTIDPEGSSSWVVRSGSVGEERPYERSAMGVSQIVRGWAHLQNEAQAVAFAVEDVGRTPGTLTAVMRGAGGVSFEFAPAEPAQEHALTLYQHFVSTPVPIGAATSPASILSPPEVRVEALP